MNCLLVDKDDYLTICSFVEGLNKANFMRSSERIPYEETQVIDMIKKIEHDNVFLYCVKNDEGDIYGGACCTYENFSGIKTGIISQVWVDPKKQRNGIAKQIIEHIEDQASLSDLQLLRLNVANIYVPAVSLYEKLGFVPIEIYANVPNSYYFIRMIKTLNGYEFTDSVRRRKLLVSKIKFSILFKKDSTPRWLHKIIYGKK